MSLSSITFFCRKCDSHGHLGGVDTLKFCPECGSEQIRCHDEILALSLVHLDCDAFYASIEKRDNPDLQDKPVIVGGGERGVVAAACYVARQYGIRSAMPSWQARKNCPDVITIQPRMSVYVKESQKIRALMLETTPLVEPLSIDEAFLDLSGTEQLHKAPPAIIASRLQRRIWEEIGITVSIGLSGNKSLAKMASDRDKPHGFFTIGMEEAKAWLAPQPVTVLFGMGKAMAERLHKHGIYSCQDLVTAKPDLLRQAIGKDSDRLRALAEGRDHRPVIPDSQAKSISAETTFASDLWRLEDLQAELEPLIYRVSERLKAKSLSGKRVSLKLKFANHKIMTRSKTVSGAINQAHQIEEIVHSLLVPEVQEGRAFRLIGVGVEGFGVTDTDIQSELSLDPKPETKERKANLEKATDKLRKELGINAIQSGRRLLYQTKKSDTNR